jgi:hypothetical protein
MKRARRARCNMRGQIELGRGDCNLESVRKHQAGLQSFRSMRRITTKIARRRTATRRRARARWPHSPKAGGGSKERREPQAGP